MKTKNQFTVIIMLLFGMILFQNCKKKKSDDVPASMAEAAIHDTCDGVINFSGTHVFAEMQTSGGFSGSLLVGSYNTAETQEVGFFLSWPPHFSNVYNTPGSFNVYYDPLNNDADPDNYADQYGAGGTSGSVHLLHLVFEADSIQVKEVEIQFEDVMVQNALGEWLCIDKGTIIKK